MKELEAARITDLEAANEYIRDHYLPAWNAEFCRPAEESGERFVKAPDRDTLDQILCERHERTVGADNCVRFRNRVLQIPPDRYRCHYVKAKVRVRYYPDRSITIHHGPRELARYDAQDQLVVKYDAVATHCPPRATAPRCGVTPTEALG